MKVRLPLVLLFVLGSIGIYLTRSTPTIRVSVTGSDQNDGIDKPVRTIQHAVNIAKNGGSISIEPGIYRESVTIPEKKSRLTLTGKGNTLHPVILRGSESAGILSWSRCTAKDCPQIPARSIQHIYSATLPWEEAPTGIFEIVTPSFVLPLPLARSPNTSVSHTDQFHKNWWNAGKESTPQTISDPMHLTYTNLLGSRAYVMDGEDRCGTYLYIRTITGPLSRGSFSTDQSIGANMYGHQENGVNTYAKYMVENNPQFLDEAGEWYYDASNHKLYYWPREEKDPRQGTIEIARRRTGITLQGSHITIRGLTIEFLNDQTYTEDPYGAFVLDGRGALSDITIAQSSVRYSGSGVSSSMQSSDTIQDIHLSDLSLMHLSRNAVQFLGSPTNLDSLKNIIISKTKVEDVGFPLSDPAIFIARARNVRITLNTISNVAGSGIHVTGYEKTPHTFDGLSILENMVTHACQNVSGCSAIKVFGGKFSHADISKNTVRDNIGWSSCMKDRFGKDGQANGIFISNAQGLTISGNHSYNNSNAGILLFTRQLPSTDNSVRDNAIERSFTGIALVGDEGDVDTDALANKTRHDRTEVIGNVMRKNSIGVLLDIAHPENFRLSDNHYQDNNILLEKDNQKIQTLEELRHIYPFWEK